MLIEKFNKFDGYLFEGEYINGQRNGKGKTYQHHNWEKKYIVEFEGEYLNGNRHGKGKEYNDYRNFFSKENISMEKNGTEKDILDVKKMI